MKRASWTPAYLKTESYTVKIKTRVCKWQANHKDLTKQHTDCFKYTALVLFSPKKTAKEHASLLTSITVKVELHNERHAPAAAVSLTDKVVRTCSSALLRQLVNTKVSQFICHVMGCRLTRALHAAWLVCICQCLYLVYLWRPTTISALPAAHSFSIFGALLPRNPSLAFCLPHTEFTAQSLFSDTRQKTFQIN